MNRHQAYEFLKARWLAANPGATPAEIERALQALARRCGV